MKSLRRTGLISLGVICFLVLSLYLIPAAAALEKGSGFYLVIAKVEKEQNRVVQRIPLTILNKRRLITVDGPLGKTTIEVVGNRARVIASPCRDKICIHFGWLSKQDDFSACIPNNILVTIEPAPPTRR